MSLISSLYSGLSGMLNYGNAMNVVGDNLSNTNTTGFKTSSVTFSDLLSAKTSGYQIGRGNKLAAVNVSQQQGSFQSTQSATDVAIEGKGYFVVMDRQDGTGTNYYTRAGNFILNSNGYLVDPTQNYVKGYVYDQTTQTYSPNPTALNLANSLSAAKATTTMTMGLNLNAGASAGATFKSSLTSYNSLGEAVTVSLTFVKQATAGLWNYSVGTSLGTVAPAFASGSLSFNSTGTLTANSQPTSLAPAATTDPSISLTGFPSGAANLTFTWDLFTALNVSKGNVTQYAAPSSVTTITQDGYTIGNLSGISIDSAGQINGTFTNGQVQTIAQLTLADFASPWNLNRVGNSLWGETQAGGQPILGVAKSGGKGSIVGSTLEMSTADMATEFTNMIQFQRAYQSSSKIVTTTDQMLQDAINLVR